MIIKNNQDEIQNYLSDASNYTGNCEAVYIPSDENEIINIIKECNKTGKRVTISGNGTGLTGGRVPEGGIVLSLEGMNKILEVNKEKKYVTIQPGVILKDLQDYLEEQKLFYPPDPTERNCHVGANVATNSSGARTFKYGPTRDYVLGLKIVLPDGEKLTLQRGEYLADGYNANLKTESGKIISFQLPQIFMPETKNAAGYYCKKDMDLIDLFIGSEGTLGIFSEIKLKIIELPEKILSCVIFFDEEINALNFIEEARDLSKKKITNDLSLISARGLEFFDYYTLQFLLDDYSNIPAEAKAAVWFEQELDDNEDEIISQWMDLISKHSGLEENSWIAADKKEQEQFKDFRHAIAWKVNEYVTRRKLKKVGTDVAVPDNVFKDFYYEAKKIVEDRGLEYVVYGHFGNSHMHLNMLPENEEEYNISKNIYMKICERAVELKGTISAEHGIGKLKRDYFLKMYSEDVIKQMAKLKLIFDPNKILNVGNIFYENYFD
ncbi:FAD-binding oxidoreductase [Rosettibacter firmus]|uniref:FAD-binding oxidoreductase n=1 Tax=Rosettibacter firmus TaxID=3111522 RepID=UPI00336BCF4D